MEYKESKIFEWLKQEWMAVKSESAMAATEALNSAVYKDIKAYESTVRG